VEYSCVPLSGQTVLSSKEVTGSVRKGISDFCLICYYNVIIIIILIVMECILVIISP